MRKLKWSDWAIHPGTTSLNRAGSSGLGQEQQKQGKGRVISLPTQPTSSWQSALTSSPHGLSVPEKELWKVILENTKTEEKIQSEFIKEIYYCKAQEHFQHTDTLRKQGRKINETNKQQNLWLIREVEAREPPLQRLSVLTWCQEAES